MRRAVALLLCSLIASTSNRVQASSLLQGGWDPASLPAADAALAGARCNIDRRPRLTLDEFDRVYRDKRPVILGNRAKVQQLGLSDLTEWLDAFGHHEVALHHPVRRGDVGIHKLSLRDHFAALTPVAGQRQGDPYNIDAESEYLESSVSDRQLLDTNPEVHTWLLRRLYAGPDKALDRSQARTTTQILTRVMMTPSPAPEARDGSEEGDEEDGAVAEVAPPAPVAVMTRPPPGMPTKRIAPEALCGLYSTSKLNCPCEVDMMVASPSGHGIAGHYHMTVQANLQVYGRKRWFFWRGPIPGGQNHRRSMREWLETVYPTLPEWMFRELSVPAAVIRAVAPRLQGEEVDAEAVIAAVQEGVEAAAAKADAGEGGKVPGWAARLLEALASDPILAAVYLGLEEANSYPLGKALNISVPERDPDMFAEDRLKLEEEGRLDSAEEEDNEALDADDVEVGGQDEERVVREVAARRRRLQELHESEGLAYDPGALVTLPPYMHECTLEPGEMMYVPNGFYHATLAVGHEINFSFKCDSDIEKWYGQRTHESDHTRNHYAAQMWKPPPPPLPLATPRPAPQQLPPDAPVPVMAITQGPGGGLQYSYSGNVTAHAFGKKPPVVRPRPWLRTPWSAQKEGRKWRPRLYDRFMLRRGVMRLFTGLELNMCSLNVRYLVANGLNGTKVAKLQHLVNFYPEDPEGLYSLAAVYLRYATPVDKLEAYEHKLLRLGHKARGGGSSGSRARGLVPRLPPAWVSAAAAEDAAAPPPLNEWGEPLPRQVSPWRRLWTPGTLPAPPRIPEDVDDLRPPPPPGYRKDQDEDALAAAGLPPLRESHVEIPREEWEHEYTKKPRWARQATLLLEAGIAWNPLMPEAYVLLSHGYATTGLWLLSPASAGGSDDSEAPSVRRPPTPYSVPEPGYPPPSSSTRAAGWLFLDQALAAATRAEELEPHSGAACNAVLDLLAWGAVPGVFTYSPAGELQRVIQEEELLSERPTLGACAAAGFDEGKLEGMPPGMSGECPALARRWLRQAVKCLSVGTRMLKSVVSYDCLQPTASELRLTTALLDWWAQVQPGSRAPAPRKASRRAAPEPVSTELPEEIDLDAEGQVA